MQLDFTQQLKGEKFYVNDSLIGTLVGSIDLLSRRSSSSGSRSGVVGRPFCWLVKLSGGSATVLADDEKDLDVDGPTVHDV